MLQPVLVTSATWRRSTMTRGEDSVREEILAEISERDNSRRLVSASARGSRGGSPRQVRRELIWRRGKVMLRTVIRRHPRTARFRTRSPNDQLRRPCCPSLQATRHSWPQRPGSAQRRWRGPPHARWRSDRGLPLPSCREPGQRRVDARDRGFPGACPDRISMPCRAPAADRADRCGRERMSCRILPLALAVVCAGLAMPSLAAAQDDDPFSCLRTARNVIELAGDHGFEQFHRFAPADRTALDARGAKWQFQTYPTPRSSVPVRITGGGHDACFIGGLIEGSNPATAGWEEMYDQSNGAAFAFGGDEPLRRFVLDGLRIHNVWDGIRPRAHADHFVIRNVWLSDARDDCIENDHFSTGVIDDSL